MCQKSKASFNKHYRTPRQPLHRHPIFDIEAVDPSSQTLLHHACYFGQLGVVKFLLDKSDEKDIDISKVEKVLKWKWKCPKVP